jgi:tetratricopeptide (TPR) repeat protein
MLIAPTLFLAAAFAQEPTPAPPAAAPRTRRRSAASAAAAPAPAAAMPAGSAQEHIDAGIAVFKRKHFAEAQSHFQAAVDAEPNNAAAHFYLGYAIYKIAEPKHPFHPDKQRAAAEFARAYELDPAFKPSW